MKTLAQPENLRAEDHVRKVERTREDWAALE